MADLSKHFRLWFSHRFRRTTILTTFCLSILVGLALARHFALVGWWLLLIFAGLCFYQLPGRRLSCLMFVTVFGGLIGLQRGTIYMGHLRRYQLFFGKPIVLVGQADSDAVYGYNSQLDFTLSRAQIISPAQPRPLVGRIKVTGFGTPMVYRGDQLQISGQLKATRGSNQARLSYAKIKLLRRGASPIDSLRRRFIAGLQSSLPEPASSFGAGILIGQRSTLPPAVNDSLSITGLTHLVAVSGYNLTIIIITVRRLLQRLSKFQTTVAAFGLMSAFVLLTGLSASIVRAALVSSLSLLAWYYGRQFRPVLLIGLAAALTAWWNPFYLWADIGWYLSFLAFFGVLMVAPLLNDLMIRHEQTNPLIGLLCETFSAQIMTLPIIMYIFGRLSVIGLASNLLIVPLVPLAMLLSLLAGLAGMFASGLAGWVAWPASWLLTYMLDLTGLLSRLPHASVLGTVSADSMIALYVFIILIIWRVSYKRRPARVLDML